LSYEAFSNIKTFFRARFPVFRGVAGFLQWRGFLRNIFIEGAR